MARATEMSIKKKCNNYTYERATQYKMHTENDVINLHRRN